MKYRANVYYCGYLNRGRFIYITEDEMLRCIVTASTLYKQGQKNQILWIGRRDVSPYEETHLFGVSIPNSEIKKYLRIKSIDLCFTHQRFPDLMPTFPGKTCSICISSHPLSKNI